MVRELAENWRRRNIHTVPEMRLVATRDEPLRAVAFRTVTIHLPHPEEVQEAILDALEDERRQNRKPRLALVGMSWWASLEQGYDSAAGGPLQRMLEGVDIRLDGTMPRGCRVVCGTFDETARFAREASKPTEPREG